MIVHSPQESERFEVLDVIRGAAALVVVLWHCYSTLSGKMQLQFTTVLATPLALLINGKAAVIVFFVLSGFVLALPYFSTNPPLYRAYLIKRLTRIYLPFAAAILLAAGLYSMTEHGPPGQEWAVGEGWMWSLPEPLTLSMVVQHLLMTGMDDSLLLDGPVWSLVHELRISIIFPLLVFICRRSWIGILISVMIAAGTFHVKAWGQFFDFPTNAVDFLSTFLATLYFAPCFLLGILLAKHRNEIRAYLSGLSGYQSMGLWAAVIAVFYLQNDFEARATLSLAAGLLMMLSLSSPTVLAAARIPVFRWLGNISYSLYLVHLPILLFLIHMLPRDFSHWSVSAIMIALSLAAASLMRRFVELPSIKFGKMLAGHLQAERLLDQRRWATVLVLGVVMLLYAQATFQRDLAWQASLRLWQNVVSNRPNTARVHVYLGDIAMTQGRLAEAIMEFRAAIHLNAAYPRPHYDLANAYATEGRLTEAIQEYQVAIQLQPDFPNSHTNLGVAYARQGRWAESIEEERRSIQLRADLPDAHYNLGNAYAREGRTEEAIQEFLTTLRLQPDFPDAHNNLGNVYASQGRIEEAMQEFQAVVRLQPNLPDAHNNLGNTYASQGRLEEAIQEFSAAIRLRSDFPEAHYDLGNAYVEQGRLEEAIQELLTAVSLRPDFLEAHYSLGNAYYRKGLEGEAIKEFEIVLQLSPDFAPARQALQVLKRR